MWVRHLDEDSTRFYFFNEETGETSWTEPEGYTGEGSKKRSIEGGEEPSSKRQVDNNGDDGEEDDGAMWVKYIDPKTKRPYYSDMNTGKTRWEQPKFYTSDQGEDDDEEDEENMEEEYAFGAVNTSNAAPSSESASKQTPDFLRYVDATTNVPYYFNTKTQSTQWDAPPEDAIVQDASQTTAQPTDGAVTGSAKYQEWLNKVAVVPQKSTTSSSSVSNDPVQRLNSILGSSATAYRWQQHFDANTQRYYYYDTETGTTQWEPPAEGAVAVGAADWAPAEVPDSQSTKEQDEYAMIAQMNVLNGRFAGNGQANEQYFQRRGIPTDKAGRQLANFFDLASFEQNRAEAKRIKEELKKKNIDWRKYNEDKKRKRHRIRNKWMYEE